MAVRGEAQRTAIARALINDPPVIIADEPTAHLDTKLSREFMDIIARLKAAQKTVIIASHAPLVYESAVIDRVVTNCGTESSPRSSNDPPSGDHRPPGLVRAHERPGPGSWADKWDMSVGSMTVTTARQQVLDFSVPYYYTPAVIAVRADSGITDLAGLDGQSLCAGAATTYENWLNNDMEALGLPESSIYARPPNVTVVPLETDQEGAQAIAAGREDFVGYVTSETVVDANIAAGFPVVKLGSPVYSEDLAAAYDKKSTLPTDSLRAEVDKLFTAMHQDGRLSELSNQWFGMDLTQAPQ